MARNIGGVACDFLKGEVGGSKMRVETWQTPGVDGYGAQQLGFGNSTFQFRAIKYGTETEGDQFILDIEALSGTVVAAENDHGTIFTRLLVRDIAVAQKVHANNFGDGMGDEGVRVEMVVGGIQDP